MPISKRNPTIKVRHEGNVAVVTIHGNFDLAARTNMFQNALEAQVAEGYQLLLLECSQAEATDPGFWNTIAMMLKQVHPSGGNIGFLGIRHSPYLRTLYEAMNLCLVFPSYEDEKTALARIAEDRLYQPGKSKE